jgi:DNA-binding transcriptional MerR regulator
LQRILLLRELGLGLPAIAEVLAGQRRNADALTSHLHWLHKEKERLDRQIAAVETTIAKLEGGEQLMAEEMFDGFDHTQYKGEVEERWGKDAYAQGDKWWTSMSAEEKAAWKRAAEDLGKAWIDAAQRKVDPASDEAQAIAQRQFDWLRGIPGTPGGGTTGPTKEYFVGLAEMYVADERFAANYGGVDGASFVRDTMKEYANRNL